MMRTLLLVMGLTLVSFNTWASSPVVKKELQGRTAKNVVYVEGLGAGFLYSVNYERHILDSLSVRVGLGYTPVSISAGEAQSTSHFFTLPIMVNYLFFSKSRHMLELGAGGTLAFVSSSASGQTSAGLFSVSSAGVDGFLTFQVGYRYQPLGGGFHFRAGLTNLIGPGLPIGGGISTLEPEKRLWGYLPLPYISFGGVF